MCDPFTALALGSAAVSAGGSLFAGESGKKAAALQADIARGNADTLLRQRQLELDQADMPRVKATFDAGRLDRQLEQVLGGQAAYFGTTGIDASSGSPLMLAGATAAQGNVDRGLIFAQAELERAQNLGRVAQISASAAGQYGQAAASSQKGDDAFTAGVIGAAASMLSGASKVFPGVSTSAPTPNAGGSFTPSVAPIAAAAPLNVAPALPDMPWWKINPTPARY